MCLGKDICFFLKSWHINNYVHAVSLSLVSLRHPNYLGFSSVQSLSHIWLFATHGLQHARSPCPSPTPGIYSNSCTLSQWCHPTISSSVVPFSCIQSFPTSGSFQMSQFFASGGQSIGVSASASVLPMNIRTDFLYDWLVWSPCSPRYPPIKINSLKRYMPI